MTTRRPGPAPAVSLVVAVVVLCLAATVPPAAAAASEWNIDRVGAPAPARGVVIAVVDTGVDAAHPVFGDRVLPAIDLLGGDGGDPNGHGTHVAGTAAGADQGCGGIGVAPDATVLPVRVLDENGEGTIGDVAEGIRLAADRGVAVINLSLGADVVLFNGSGGGLDEAIRYAWAKGSIPVLAAGNDGLFGGLFGSGYGDLPAVVVTATDNRDRAPGYATSIGSAMWGVAAPGGDGSGVEGRDVLSAFPGRRCALSAGTSMSAPHVSGALAALRATGLGQQQAVDRLLDTARPIGSRSTYGHGLIDLRAALAAPAQPAPTTTVAPPPPAPTTTAAGPSSPEQPSAATPPPGGRAPATAVPGDGTVPVPAEPAPTTAPTGTDAAAGQQSDDPAPTTSPDAPQAAPLVLRDVDGGGGQPVRVVVLAVGALVGSGLGLGFVVRSLGRRPGA